MGLRGITDTNHEYGPFANEVRTNLFALGLLNPILVKFSCLEHSTHKFINSVKIAKFSAMNFTRNFDLVQVCKFASLCACTHMYA